MAFKIRYYNAKILNKDDLEFVTEFPCLLGHPVCSVMGEINAMQNSRCVIFIVYACQIYWYILYLNNHCLDGSDNRFCPGCVSAPTPATPTLPLR